MRYAEASYGGESGSSREPAVPSSVLGMIVFILTEMMFFTSLISAYMIVRVQADANAWPPPDQPRLPLSATGFNSLVLLSSGVLMFFAYRAFKRNPFCLQSSKLLKTSAALGVFFVCFQGYEWAQLLAQGVTVRSGNYASFFYLIIGTHALHAVGALFIICRLVFLFRKGTLRTQTFSAGALFWYFVVGIWPVLYVLVYLN